MSGRKQKVMGKAGVTGADSDEHQAAPQKDPRAAKWQAIFDHDMERDPSRSRS